MRKSNRSRQAPARKANRSPRNGLRRNDVGEHRKSAAAGPLTSQSAWDDDAAWDDYPDELDLGSNDFDDMRDNSRLAAGATVARRRIEILQEERLLRQALSDIFDS